ncbi:MAG: 16S rRNA processing protein RimM [Dehalococcoidia bacterium]|nr:16S rRNA processing protein RimM [Dehalococcoidia bacterium]
MGQGDWAPGPRRHRASYDGKGRRRPGGLPREPGDRGLRPRPTRPARASDVIEPRPGFTALARVLRPHGLNGELRVQAFAPGAPNLKAGARVAVAGVEHRVVRCRPEREQWLVMLSGVTSREAAEGLRAEIIEMRDDHVQREDAQSFFLHELIGLRTVTDDGRELGRVTEVLQPGANDVYVVQGPYGELLLPATPEVVLEIDLAQGGGVIVVRPLPGMLPEEPPHEQASPD